LLCLKYTRELDNGSVITKCKGYPGKLSKDQYLELFKGNSINLPVTKWLRSLKNSTIQIKRNMPYVINPLFNKRQKVFENGKWVDTRPLILGQSNRGSNTPFLNSLSKLAQPFDLND